MPIALRVMRVINGTHKGGGLKAVATGKMHGSLGMPLPDTSLLNTLLSEWAPQLA